MVGYVPCNVRYWHSVWSAMCRAVSGTVLRTPYVMSGTGIAYGTCAASSRQLRLVVAYPRSVPYSS
eukprot:3903737-Rhodomonas_salina.1